MKEFYLIGSLRNPYIPVLEKRILKDCPEVKPFAEWYGAGEKADDAFKEYNKGRGLTYKQALMTDAAKTIFEFDKYHLERADGAILVMPAGKSCHLEAAWVARGGKPVYVLFPDGEPEDRYEIMMQFLDEIFYSENELIEYLNANYGSESILSGNSVVWPRSGVVSSASRSTQGRVSGRIDVC